ncbi:uncharacterized protein LOC141911963 [Tubulanus polymorphus]|uniref:uncharacterized protein LOC141911963 n=1 Tax=Tubulanus polymorphus TaxID=672921 RepID=UPI003DA5A054
MNDPSISIMKDPVTGSHPCSDRIEEVLVRKRHSLSRRDSEEFGIIEMRSTDSNIRARAALRLAARPKNEAIVEVLVDALHDSDRLVRESAALALGHLKVEDAVPELLELWRNDVISNVRQGAQLSLKLIGNEDAKKAIEITDMIETAVDELDFEVLERFVGKENVGNIGGLRHLLSGSDANTRAAAAIGIGLVGNIDANTLESLVHATEDKDRLCRQAACTVLGYLNYDQAISRLASVWKNDFISSVRRSAGRALDRIGGDSAKNAVMETTLLSRAINTLAGEGSGEISSSTEAADDFIKGLTSHDRIVREACCLVLGHLKTTLAAQQLINIWSNDPISNVRRAAENALEKIGGDEAEKAIRLTNAITDEIEQLSRSQLYRAYSIQE